MRVVTTTLPSNFEELVQSFTSVLDSNAKILAYIHQRVDTRPSQVISGVFIEHVGSLKAYAEYFGDHRPARACVVSELVLPGAIVEIDAIAIY